MPAMKASATPVLSLMALLGTALAGPLYAADTAATPPAPAQAALTGLADSAGGPLPPGTRLRSVRITDGLATADFSRELRDNFHGGDTEEALAVNAILKAMGRFPAVSRVQILVEGQRVDSLGGLLVISDPLPVIRPTVRYFHRRPSPK